MRVGELAAEGGVANSAIRFYEEQGLLAAPERTAGGYRDYGPEAVARVRFIRRAQSAGLQLKEIGEILRIHDAGQAPCRHVTSVLQNKLQAVSDQIEELQRLQEQLQEMLGRVTDTRPEEHNADAEICWIIENS